jgi:hypothetical protein
MPLRRALTVSAGGVAVVILQALVLGNQWVVEWMFNHDILDGSGAAGFLRSVLLFPHWRLTPAGGFRSMLVPDFGLLGWWATFLAASAAAFVTQFLSGLFFDFPAYFSLAVANGLHYALVVGWVPGVAVMAAYVLTRPSAAPGWTSEGPAEPAGA